MFKSLCALSAAYVTASAASSKGCGQDTPFSLGELTSQWVESSHDNRTYLVNLPKGYKNDVAAPLILSYHGSSRSAKDQSENDHFTDEDWNPNSIVVYPQGLDNQWQGAPYVPSSRDDLTFTTDLLTKLQSTLCIDPSRIYCTGKSLGGGFCNLLACSSTHSSLLAAIAPVAGAFYTTPSNESFASNCKPSHTIPVLDFHGYSDPTIPFDGGHHNGVDLPSIKEWASDWAAADGCKRSDDPSVQKQQDGNVTVSRYSCKGAEDVVQYYALKNLGHTWPSTEKNFDNAGQKKKDDVDASPIILEFFGNWNVYGRAGSGSSSSSTASATGTATSTGNAGGKATSTAQASATSSAGASVAMATGLSKVVGVVVVGVLVL